MRTSILLDTPSLPGSIFNSRIKCKYTKFDILNYLKNYKYYSNAVQNQIQMANADSKIFFVYF